MIFKESETIEFKKSTSELKEAVISVVAMLNKRGRAEVYFGIADDGTVLGQMVGRNTIKDVTQAVVDNTEPRVFPKVDHRNIDGKECVVVEAHGTDNPYFAYGRAYIRVGESDKALSVREIEKLFLGKKKLLWEREISEKTINDVNEEAVKEFMRKAKTAKRVDFDFVDVKTTLHKLHLLNGNRLLHAAETLFCDDNTLEVQAAIFAGTDKVTFLDIKSFKGNLFSLRQQAEVYVNGNMKWRAEIKTGPRKEIPEIPVEAVREAIGNSLCHRDYSNPKGNEVAIFRDRIEIYNPGLFPDEIDPEDFFFGNEHSILRNPLIAETMYKSKDIERWGSGIKRIHDECVSAGIKVEFKRLKTGFVVVFYRPKWEDDAGPGIGINKAVEKTVEKTVEIIFDLIKDDPRITQKRIMDKTGLTRRGVEWNLRKLKYSGRIKRVGPDKGGYWEALSGD
ncbi:MAG: putative DNA binding domain-containing protein [Candidatus Omnitrophica bacterium]|nr:putative DNA binding domain-containing protein [Candidatus Omnitrophota bacterium]